MIIAWFLHHFYMIPMVHKVMTNSSKSGNQLGRTEECCTTILFCYLPSGFFFTTLQLLIHWLPLLRSLLHCFSCNKKTRDHWVIRLTCEIFSGTKLWLWRQLKVDIISPWKRVLPFIWTKLIPLHPWLLSAMFDWNWTSGFGVFNAFSLLSPLENGCCPTFK